jgi:hypothetical protein
MLQVLVDISLSKFYCKTRHEAIIKERKKRGKEIKKKRDVEKKKER